MVSATRTRFANPRVEATYNDSLSENVSNGFPYPEAERLALSAAEETPSSAACPIHGAGCEAWA